ncbi:MAG: hypothetical protein ABFS30_07180 [Pseudomonadota bacterium]
MCAGIYLSPIDRTVGTVWWIGLILLAILGVEIGLPNYDRNVRNSLKAADSEMIVNRLIGRR